MGWYAPLGSAMSAATTIPTLGRSVSVFSTATRKMGRRKGCPYISLWMGHALSCTKRKGTVGDEPAATQRSRQSAIISR
jgi:hypothetical protein